MFLKFQRSFIFIIKLMMFLLLTFVFFHLFSIKIPQLKTINRTSVISVFTFFISSYMSIKLYGGFPIGKKHASVIKNSAILGTLFGNIVTFITMHIMSISKTNYLEFLSQNSQINDISKNTVNTSFSIFFKNYMQERFLPSCLTLLFVFVIQIFIIWIFAKISNSLYFKMIDPKKTIVIYENTNDLILLVCKIKKSPFRWEIVDLIKYNDKNILDKIKENEAIFFANIPKKNRNFLLNYCYKHSKCVYLYPDICDVILYCSTRLSVDDITIFSTTEYNMSFEQMFLKRLGDIIFSIFALIITSPISLFAAIAIKLYDKGPIIFKQQRLTINGKRFNLLKFRSMNVDNNDSNNPKMTEQDDCRVTPIGKFLRRFRIDEIPQFLNILKGELSVVGPRAERVENVEEFEAKLPEFKYRLKVKAGLTGLAQILGKYNSTPKDKLTLDLTYIQKYSLWLDIKIIIKTLIVFLKNDSTEGVVKVDEKIIKFVNSKLKKNKIK